MPNTVKIFPLALMMLLMVFSVEALASESDGQIAITRRGTQPATVVSDSNYTGLVRLEQGFQTIQPANLAGELLSLEPAARSNWHTNPMGQAILVTSGKVIVQEENGPLEELFPGDVAIFPPKVRHWFGASPDMGAAAWIMAEADGGANVAW